MKKLEDMTIAELASFNENSEEMISTLKSMSDRLLVALGSLVDAEMARRWRLLQGVTPAPEE